MLGVLPWRGPCRGPSTTVTTTARVCGESTAPDPGAQRGAMRTGPHTPCPALLQLMPGPPGGERRPSQGPRLCPHPGPRHPPTCGHHSQCAGPVARQAPLAALLELSGLVSPGQRERASFMRRVFTCAREVYPPPLSSHSPGSLGGFAESERRGQQSSALRGAAVSPCLAPCLPRPALGTPGTPFSGEMSLDRRGVRAARASPEHARLLGLAARAEGLSAGEQARGNPRLGRRQAPGEDAPRINPCVSSPAAPHMQNVSLSCGGRGAAPGWRPSRQGLWA